MGMCIANDAMCIHRYDDIIIALQIIHKVFFQKARHNPIATKYYLAQMRSMRKSIRRNKARAFDYDLIQEEGIFERVTIDQHPLTEKEFEQLCKYYKGLGADNSSGAVMNYDELFATPDAESNTIVNKDSVASCFKEIANQYGKEAAIRAMESFLKRRYTRLNGLSLRATTLFQKLVECTVPLTTDGNPETDFLNGQRRLPYADIDAEVASKSIKRASLLYTRPYNLTDADKDLASKKNVHLSQYFHIDANGKIQRETTQSFYLLLRGKTKPTKADILAALYRACTTNWLNKCDDDKEFVRQHVIEFCKLATAILKAAMLPPFVVENPLEQCYLLAVVAFHEGYVLFYEIELPNICNCQQVVNICTAQDLEHTIFVATTYRNPLPSNPDTLCIYTSDFKRTQKLAVLQEKEIYEAKFASDGDYIILLCGLNLKVYKKAESYALAHEVNDDRRIWLWDYELVGKKYLFWDLEG